MPFGKYSYYHKHPEIRYDGKSELYVGKFCSLSPFITIYLGGNHRTDWISTYPFGTEKTGEVFTAINVYERGHPFTKGDVVIGNDVWIADHVSIMSGVKIGDGAVISGYSHVVKDVEPYTIVGGNPARFIRHRFSKEQIDQLLKIKWWDWEDKKINDNLHLICSPNIDVFINEHRV
jgi:acetyltransferase-like isoleucine patch superfamily enzyme|uniref:Acetyltransferase n=1 Tax=viral metagenome TaxID=1070528 RepID=A0A6C0KZ01_9ZZZZ